MNVFFNERTQYLLFALAQWYHLLIHPQNTKLVLMILHLSMMIASSLHLRLQIQNSTVNVGLSRGFYSSTGLFKSQKRAKQEANGEQRLSIKGAHLLRNITDTE